MIGCDCSVCTSTDPRNQRTRPSVLLRFPGGNLLIDTTPEMRIQLLRERMRLVHAIAFTHHHADHLFGLDDARQFPRWTGGPVPVYCEQDDRGDDPARFHYAFGRGRSNGRRGSFPSSSSSGSTPGVEIEVLGERIMPIRLEHGKSPVLGFRVGGLAYCTDVSRIPDESWPLLQGLDVLVLDALRYEKHPTHFSLSEALAVVETLRPRRTFLTHLSHSFDHGTTQEQLPPGRGPGP